MSETTIRELKEFQEELERVSVVLGWGTRITVAINDGRSVKVGTEL